jgi:SAM-dependent methyltransferase
MSRLAVRSLQEEQMDDPALPAGDYDRILKDLGRVNRWTLAARPTLSFLRRASRGRTSFRLLDVGFGDGGMLRLIARWARKSGIDAELVGVDLNPKSAAVAAAARPPDLAIDYRTGDYRDLAGFDIVISSLVAHHMTPPELRDFLRYMEARAELGWLVNDLHRHSFAYLGYPLLARLLRVHKVVREDGRLSIARAFRPAEWHSILGEAGVSGARVYRAFPFRLCVERLR